VFIDKDLLIKKYNIIIKRLLVPKCNVSRPNVAIRPKRHEVLAILIASAAGSNICTLTLNYSALLIDSHPGLLPTTL